jgi:HSP20 family protein
MALPSLWRWSRSGRSVPVRREDHPLFSLQRDMNRLFEDFWRGFDLPSLFDDHGWAFGAFEPRVDVEETADEVRVTAELPGLDEKDFEVTLSGDTLVLKGEKREEHEDRAQGWRERRYGAFERTIPLPVEVEADRASAQFKNGVLRVRLPKSAQAREQAKRIPVTTA